MWLALSARAATLRVTALVANSATISSLMEAACSTPVPPSITRTQRPRCVKAATGPATSASARSPRNAARASPLTRQSRTQSSPACPPALPATTRVAPTVSVPLCANDRVPPELRDVLDRVWQDRVRLLLCGLLAGHFGGVRHLLQLQLIHQHRRQHLRGMPRLLRLMHGRR